MSKKKHKEREEGQSPEPEAPEASGSVPPAEAAELARQRDDLTARLQRVSADYLNYQKRVQRDIEEVRRFGITDLARGLLDVLDDLERAIAHAAENHDPDDPLLVGTRLTHRKALELLRRFGVECIEAEGQPFDPARHEAIARSPSDEVEPMTVLTVTQKGYTLAGRTIRPSKVVVAVAPVGEAEAAESTAAEEEDGADADV